MCFTASTRSPGSWTGFDAVRPPNEDWEPPPENPNAAESRLSGSLPWHLDPLEGLQLSDILSLNREFGPLWLLKIGDVALAAVLSRWEGASISPATSPDQMWLGGAWGG